MVACERVSVLVHYRGERESGRGRRLLQSMEDAGFRRVFLGIETPVEESLKEAQKGQNTRRDLLDRSQDPELWDGGHGRFLLSASTTTLRTSSNCRRRLYARAASARDGRAAYRASGYAALAAARERRPA